MPKAIKYLDPNDQNRPSNQLLGTERDERRTQYATAHDYYTGNHPRLLDRKEDEPDDNAIINLFKQSVDRTVTFLFPSMPSFELDPNRTEQSPEEKWLEDAWAANGGIALLHEMAYLGALSGHVYVRVLQADPFEGEEYPQIIPLAPGSVVTYWQADNHKRVVWHEQRWTVDHDEYILDIVKRPEKGGWDLKQWVRTKGGAWELEDDRTEFWRSPYGPIVHWQHLINPSKFYGLSEADNLDLNDKVNLIASENNRIIRYHSSPKTIGTGVNSAEEINRVGADEMWTVGNEDAEIYNLEMKSDLRTAREHEQFLQDNYFAERRVVILRGEVKDFQRVTNAGVRTVFMDMLAKNSILRWNYGTGLREVSRRLMWLYTGNDQLAPTVIHADPLPVDDTEAVNVAAIEHNMKIASRQTISTKRGYNWNIERQRMQQESEIFGAPLPGQTTNMTDDTNSNLNSGE